MKLTIIGDGSILSKKSTGGKEQNTCFFIGSWGVLEAAYRVVSTLPSWFSEYNKEGKSLFGVIDLTYPCIALKL